MVEVPVGTKGEVTLAVTPEMAVGFLGAEGARVLSTPHMIGLMEITARNAVKDVLEPGQDTVGTHVNVKHLGATPIGMQVTVRTELTAAEGRRLEFKVEAFDEKEKIGEGTHRRFVIDVKRFASQVQAKLARG